MPKMGNTGRVISRTRTDAWTTASFHIKSGEKESFCLDNCPHKDKPCKGDCPEMKEFRKNHKRR